MNDGRLGQRLFDEDGDSWVKVTAGGGD